MKGVTQLRLWTEELDPPHYVQHPFSDGHIFATYEQHDHYGRTWARYQLVIVRPGRYLVSWNPLAQIALGRVDHACFNCGRWIPKGHLKAITRSGMLPYCLNCIEKPHETRNELYARLARIHARDKRGEYIRVRMP